MLGNNDLIVVCKERVYHDSFRFIMTDEKEKCMRRAWGCLFAIVVAVGCSPTAETTSSTSGGGDAASEAAAGSTTTSPLAGMGGLALPSSVSPANPVAADAAGDTAAPLKPPVLAAPEQSRGPELPFDLNAPSNGQVPPAMPAIGQGADPVRQKAGVGSGQPGRSLANETGIGAMIVQPARSLFAVRERAVFEIQIPQAMQLFQATQGRAPNSHDEFMAQIIQANNINLPRLPAGHRYQYDPERGELMVEKPGT